MRGMRRDEVALQVCACRQTVGPRVRRVLLECAYRKVMVRICAVLPRARRRRRGLLWDGGWLRGERAPG